MAHPMKCFRVDLPLLEVTACTQHPVAVSRICELFCAFFSVPRSETSYP